MPSYSCQPSRVLLLSLHVELNQVLPSNNKATVKVYSLKESYIFAYISHDEVYFSVIVTVYISTSAYFQGFRGSPSEEGWASQLLANASWLVHL